MGEMGCWSSVGHALLVGGAGFVPLPSLKAPAGFQPCPLRALWGFGWGGGMNLFGWFVKGVISS